MFKPMTFLINDIESGDIERIQDGLSTYLTKNPSDENLEVSNVVNYVEKNFSGQIWNSHDGRELESDTTKWNKEYLGLLKSDLRNNFSKKRFYHILQVGKVVYPAKKKTATLQTTPVQKNPRVQPRQDGVKLHPWVIAGAVIVTATIVIILLNKGE
jgi:hypothetical protein